MNNILIYLLIIAALVIGAYLLFFSNVNQENMPQQNLTDIKPMENTTTHEVIFTDSGYSPSELTIKAGDTVVFKNNSTQGMWTASAIHPSHMVYGGTSLQEHCPDLENNDFDQCKSAQPGELWSFTFSKTGAFGYHNHVNISHLGKIIVQ